MLGVVPVPFLIPPPFFPSIMIIIVIIIPIEDFLIPSLLSVFAMISQGSIECSTCNQKKSHPKNEPFLRSSHIIFLSLFRHSLLSQLGLGSSKDCILA